MTVMPPFFPNYDGMRCWQSSLRSALEMFEPDRVWAWGELDKLSGRKAGKWSWPMKTLAELPKMGYEVIAIDPFAYRDFAKEPEATLRRDYSEGMATANIENSDLDAERKYTLAMLKAEEGGAFSLKSRSHKASEFQTYLRQGYAIILWVNSATLNGMKGNFGHFILVYGMEDGKLVFHDSGSAAKHHPARREWVEHVMHACRSGGDVTGGFYALKPIKKKVGNV